MLKFYIFFAENYFKLNRNRQLLRKTDFIIAFGRTSELYDIYLDKISSKIKKKKKKKQRQRGRVVKRGSFKMYKLA